MEAEMEKRKNILPILGIVVILGIGYCIPSIVMWVKDLSLLYEEKEVEIEAIQLDSQDVDMMEALHVFSDMISNHLIVEMGDSFKMTYAEAMKDEETSIPSELYRNIQDFLTMLDVKEEVILAEFYAQNYVMMAKGTEEKMYSIWVCKGIDKRNVEYHFWVDATLNKVMAFDVPFEIFGKGEEAFYSGLDRVTNYYDFASYGCALYSYAYDMSDMVKTKYWKNELEVIDKEFEILISLGLYRDGERFLFNVMPGNAGATYDAEK